MLVVLVMRVHWLEPASEYIPAGHGVAEEELQNELAGHRLQLDAPACEANLPALHAVHSLTLFATE